MVVLDVLPKAMFPILLGKHHVPRGEKLSLKSGDSCSFRCQRMSLMLIAAPVSLVKAWHPPLQQRASQHQPASKEQEGKQTLQVLYYLLSMDATFNFYW